MYIVYFRRRWSVGWRYSSGEIHFVAGYPNIEEAKKAAARMNGTCGEEVSAKED